MLALLALCVSYYIGRSSEKRIALTLVEPAMNETNDFSTDRIRLLQDKVARAIEAAQGTGVSQLVSDTLHEAGELLATLVGSRRNRFSDSAGYIDCTLDDEACEPYGREVDVRIYYDWQDYDAADEPFPVWGADIAEVEVRAVRYFDRAGETQAIGRHHDDVAWELVEKDRESLIERCTDDGCRRAVGVSHPLYSPSSLTTAAPASTDGARRMAPSARARASSESQHKFG
jgi:hypothetical protein